jgi:hypothetical protein
MSSGRTEEDMIIGRKVEMRLTCVLSSQYQEHCPLFKDDRYAGGAT